MEVTSGDDPISIPTWLRTFPSRTVGCKTIVKTSGFVSCYCMERITSLVWTAGVCGYL